MNIKKTLLATVVSLLVVSCASGGGGFDVESSNPPNNITSNAEKSPAYVTEKDGQLLSAPQAEDLTEMGWVATVPWGTGRDNSLMDKDYNDIPTSKRTISEARSNLNPQDYDVVLFKPDYPLTQDQKARPESIEVIDQNGKKVWKRAVKNISDVFSIDSKEQGKTLVFYADAGDRHYIYLKITEYGDAKVGLIELVEQDPKTVLPRKQDYANIFYQVREKTMDMPTSGKATYQGVWEYATYTPQKGSGSGAYFNNGKQEGGISKQNNATFTVDFSDRTVSGKLDATDNNSKRIVYDINAKITENGFRGNATKNDETTLFKEDSANLPLPETANVLGTFAGKKAKQLAGRVWDNGKTFAGVFAAQQDSDAQLTTDGKRLNAQTLTFAQDSSTFTDDKPQSQNFSGNLNKVQIDGIIVDLDTSKTDDVCCDDFSFLRFGLENHKVTKQMENQTEQEVQKGNLFVQGYVTPISEIPTSGQVKYKGYWYGFGKSEKANVSKRHYDAEFSADFDRHQVSGKLKNNSDTDAVTFSNLPISENGFKGKATLDVHDGNTTGSGTAINGEANVEGYFYGSNANEIGGTVIKADKTFGAVFGGKQIKE